MDIKEFIIEEVSKLHKKTLSESFGVSRINPMEIAEELVKSGVIKDNYTDLSGKHASSELGFMVKAILDKLGL